jgi:hypothetical protein
LGRWARKERWSGRLGWAALEEGKAGEAERLVGLGHAGGREGEGAWAGRTEKEKKGRRRGKWAGLKEKKREGEKEMHSNAFEFKSEI